MRSLPPYTNVPSFSAVSALRNGDAPAAYTFGGPETAFVLYRTLIVLEKQTHIPPQAETVTLE